MADPNPDKDQPPKEKEQPKEENHKNKLDLEKLGEEISLLKEKIISEKRINKTTMSDQVKNWLGLIVTTVGVGAGIFALYEAIHKYQDYRTSEDARIIAEQKRLAKEQVMKERELKFNLDEKMVDLVDQLESDATSERSIMMLQYFGKDAIPILLFRLERTGRADDVIDAIDQIFNNNNVDKIDIIARIRQNARYLFERECKKGNPNNMNIQGMKNYISLLSRISSYSSYSKHFSEDSVKISSVIGTIHDTITKEALLKRYKEFSDKVAKP